MVLATGAIVGIAVGGVVLLVVLVAVAAIAVCVVIKKRKRKHNEVDYRELHTVASSHCSVARMDCTISLPNQAPNQDHQTGSGSSSSWSPASHSVESIFDPYRQGVSINSNCRKKQSQEEYKIIIVNEKRLGVGRPQLRCLIIGSPGDQAPLPGSVPKLKMSAYLPGVSKDVNGIQEMLREDPTKDISMVPQDGFTSNNLLRTCKKYIEDQMNDVILSKNLDHSNGGKHEHKHGHNGRKHGRKHGHDGRKDGLLIWYSGHGMENTGDWPMKDGFLKFEDIYNLYTKRFKGRPLYIVTDCCYSGAWVVKCAQLLDRDGIKCGERAGMNIKVFASCLPLQKAYDKFYMERKGTRLHTNEDKIICFAEYRKLCSQGDHAKQFTLGVDFTRYRDCVKSGGKNCGHLLKWAEYVNDLIRLDSSNNYNYLT